MTHPIHSADAERAAFEALFVTISESAANPRLFDRVSDDRRYCSMEVEYAWQTYRAVRATVQVGANGAADLMIDIRKAIRLADAVGVSRADNRYARNKRAVKELVDLEMSIERRLAAGAPASPQHPRLTDEVMSGVAQKLEAAGFSRVSGAPAETPKPITKEWCETMAAREIEFDGNIEAGVETPKPDALARMAHDFPALQAFHTKHALGPMLAPSCLCCGQQTHPLTRPVAIKHGELPGIVVCAVCRDAAATPSATIGAGEGKDAAQLDAVVEANRALLHQRSQLGIKKYGGTLGELRHSRRALMQHALEEALDLANYLQADIQEIDRTAIRSKTSPAEAG